MSDLETRIAALPDKSLLLLDDDQALRTRMGRALEARGFQVTTADSVAAATAALRDHAPAFAVLDMRLEMRTAMLADALGVAPEQVFKTLMVLVDGAPACVIVPSDCEVSMKKLAAVLGAKSGQMMKPADAERLTGYKVGGVSPFGQKRAVPTVVDQAALGHDRVFVNGGQRGLQVRLSPADLVAAVPAKVAPLT